MLLGLLDVAPGLFAGLAVLAVCPLVGVKLVLVAWFAAEDGLMPEVEPVPEVGLVPDCVVPDA